MQAEVVGKPAPDLINTAAREANVALDRVVMIGDSLETDSAAAGAAGVRSILMLTGVTSSDDAERVAALGGSTRPTRVARDVEALARILAELRAD